MGNAREFYVGASLGGGSIPTALIVIERIIRDIKEMVSRPDGMKKERVRHEFHYEVKKAERISGMSSPALAEKFSEIKEKLHSLDGGSHKVRFVADVSGPLASEALIQMFKNKRIDFESLVIITTMEEQHREEKSHKWKVPRKNLVGVILTLFEEKKLVIAQGLKDIEALAREFTDFDQQKIKQQKNQTDEEPWREKINDDYLFALAVALWESERQGMPCVIKPPRMRKPHWTERMFRDGGGRRIR
ncbi:MAG: hypothetical protein RDV48_04605 [Candidatus Eremiobacteraeota bacterium]|nr:hypothetical protein [Candidatus Eremiobacteraeota bacterium]